MVSTDIVHPDDREEAIEMHYFLLKTGKSPFDFFPMKIKKKDGEYINTQAMKSIPLGAKKGFLAIHFVIPEGEEGITKFTEDYLEYKNKSNGSGK